MERSRIASANKNVGGGIRTRLLLLCFLACVGFVWFGLLNGSKPAANSRQPHRVSTDDGVTRVLFIGNSYTYVNNLPGQLIALSQNESKPVDAEMVVFGGATLERHLADGTAVAAIRRGHWDYVILQEQSTLGLDEQYGLIGDPTSFYGSVSRIDREIRNVGAKTMLFMTWSREQAPQNQSALTNAYTHAAEITGAIVSPVGLAWERHRATVPGSPNLYQSDGSHPSQAGTYLSALVLYGSIYQKSPQGLTSQIHSSMIDNLGQKQTADVDLNSETAEAIQASADAEFRKSH
jgi:hypothetical protein